MPAERIGQKSLLSAHAHAWFCVNGTQGWGRGWHIAQLSWMLSRCSESEASDEPKVFNQNDPLAFPTGRLQHGDVGGPGDLWAYGALSYVFIVPSLSASHMMSPSLPHCLESKQSSPYPAKTKSYQVDFLDCNNLNESKCPQTDVISAGIWF